jgi:thiamine pyrophosphate-dependent acetolactate synthase large subunit-like protein
MRIYEAMAEAVGSLQVPVVFGLMGDGNLRFVTHLIDKVGVDYVGARHENTAVAMADGFAACPWRPRRRYRDAGPGPDQRLDGAHGSHEVRHTAAPVRR